jgi:hypothetical protein
MLPLEAGAAREQQSRPKALVGRLSGSAGPTSQENQSGALGAVPQTIVYGDCRHPHVVQVIPALSGCGC